MGIIISGMSFPAIQGIQAGREYYIVMCPLKRLKKIFTFDETELAVQERAQRVLNHSRIPQITKYIHDNREDYTFSSVTACIDGDASFTPIAEHGHGSKIGTLTVDEDAEFYLTDGQHRSAAIQKALEEDPSLGNETISVVFFVGKNLEQRQKIFRDLNLYPVPTSKSLAVVYGNSAEDQFTKRIATESKFFDGVVELSDTRLSKRSAKLFMLSSLQLACLELCKKVDETNWKAEADKAIKFWDELAKNLPLWQQAKNHEIKPADRQHYILFTAIALKSFAILGRELMAEHKNWKALLKGLSGINWDRASRIWSNRCYRNGRMDHSKNSAMLTVNALKKHLELPLNDEQQKIEDRFRGQSDG